MDSRECWGRRREGGIMEHRREEYLGQAGQMLPRSPWGDSADYPALPELKTTIHFYTHTHTQKHISTHTRFFWTHSHANWWRIKVPFEIKTSRKFAQTDSWKKCGIWFSLPFGTVKMKGVNLISLGNVLWATSVVWLKTLLPLWDWMGGENYPKRERERERKAGREASACHVCQIKLSRSACHVWQLPLIIHSSTWQMSLCSWTKRHTLHTQTIWKQQTHKEQYASAASTMMTLDAQDGPPRLGTTRSSCGDSYEPC